MIQPIVYDELEDPVVVLYIPSEDVLESCDELRRQPFEAATALVEVHEEFI